MNPKKYYLLFILCAGFLMVSAQKHVPGFQGKKHIFGIDLLAGINTRFTLHPIINTRFSPNYMFVFKRTTALKLTYDILQVTDKRLIGAETTLGHGPGLQFKFYLGSSPAPVGPYASIGATFLRVKVNEVGPPSIGTNPAPVQYSVVPFKVGLGVNRIIARKLFLSYGLELALSSTTLQLINQTGNHQASKEELFWHYLFNAKIGIGFLAF